MSLYVSYILLAALGVTISGDEVDLKGHISYLEDTTRELTIDQIRSPGTRERFAPSPKGESQFWI